MVLPLPLAPITTTTSLSCTSKSIPLITGCPLYPIVNPRVSSIVLPASFLGSLISMGLLTSTPCSSRYSRKASSTSLILLRALITPSSKRITSSTRSRKYLALCSTTIEALPKPLTCSLKYFLTSLTPKGSIEAVGSSNNIMGGSCTIAEAIVSLLFSPPDSFSILTNSLPAKPNMSSILLVRSSISLKPRFSKTKLTSS